MALLSQWTWVWANYRRYWRIGKPGVLPYMGFSRTWLSNWATTTPKGRLNPPCLPLQGHCKLRRGLPSLEIYHHCLQFQVRLQPMGSITGWGSEFPWLSKYCKHLLLSLELWVSFLTYFSRFSGSYIHIDTKMLPCWTLVSLLALSDLPVRTSESFSGQSPNWCPDTSSNPSTQLQEDHPKMQEQDTPCWALPWPGTEGLAHTCPWVYLRPLLPHRITSPPVPPPTTHTHTALQRACSVPHPGPSNFHAWD